jgi:hypothetical protein
MRHLVMLASLGLLLSPFTADSLVAQTSVAQSKPSPRAECLLKMLAAEGFRLPPSDSIGSELLLTRTLTSVDVRTGMPEHSNTRVQLIEVRVDGAELGLVLERAFVLRPEAGDQSALAAESQRLDRDIRARLAVAEPRCPG